MAGKPWTLNELRHFRDVVAKHPFVTWRQIAKLHGYGRSPKAVQLKARELGLRRIGRTWVKMTPPVHGPDMSGPLRNAAFFVQRDVSEIGTAAGIARATVRRWLRGHPPQLRLLTAWAQEAGTTVEALCRDKGI